MKIPIMISLITLSCFSGCVNTVSSWQKEQLAKDIMQPSGANTLLGAHHEHIYFSKEASFGGHGVSGGGCGCK